MDAIRKDSKLDAAAGWYAHLQLRFEKQLEKTVVRDVAHRGPLRIQRPFYPEQGGAAHVYLLHPPGGVAGGDHLQVEMHAGGGAQVVCTAPAATKLYRSAGADCQVRQDIRVGKGCTFEWLPQETIVFSGARAQLRTVVSLEQGAEFCGWEILALGRAAAGESFERGKVSQLVEVERAGCPLYSDRLTISGTLEEEASCLGEPWGLAGRSVVASMLLATDRPEVVEAVSAALVSSRSVRSPSLRIASSALRGITVIRCLADSVAQCWQQFVRIWEQVRPLWIGRPPSRPRIWSY